MKKLSGKAWDMARPVVEAIQQHPFNQELMLGTLAKDKFSYYIEQDVLYLRDFSKAHAIIASRVPLDYVQCFLRYADYTLVTEQEIVHQFFSKTLGFQETGKIAPATLAYTSYLLSTCAHSSVEVAIASVLPCFWVYREVGLVIFSKTTPSNPYFRWIETYAGDEFKQSVLEAIDIFDAMASFASREIQQQMLEAFYKSTVLEWHFWNDAYHQTVLDGFLLKLVD